jgi:hypothetical protein
LYDVAKDIKIAAIVKFIEARTLSNAGESSDASNLFSIKLLSNCFAINKLIFSGTNFSTFFVILIKHFTIMSDKKFA